MTTQISINVISGNSEVTQTDRERAEQAALEVLASAGLTVAEAFAEFKRQWEEFDDYGPMTGAAAVWVEAEQLANIALTYGWADPNGATCGISA